MRKTNPTPRVLALATLATGLLAAGILVAAPQDAGHGKHRMHQTGGNFLEKIDTDKDGNISKAEHEAARAKQAAARAERLAQVDRNNDGFVTFEEQKAAREAWKAQREAKAGERFVKRHDKNGDGRVAVAEMAAMADRGAVMFERMDANKDGMVSKDEMRQGHGERPRHGRRTR